MKWSKKDGNGEIAPATKTNTAPILGNGDFPRRDGGGDNNGNTLNTNNPPIKSSTGSVGSSSSQPKTGNNLEKKSADKSVKVEFDIEKLKAAFPKFIRLVFKAFNNIFRLISAFPFMPIQIYFDDLSPEEEEIFKEAAWPGFEAALPAAAKKHPMAFLMSALTLLTFGKVNFKLKPKKEPENTGKAV